MLYASYENYKDKIMKRLSDKLKRENFSGGINVHASADRHKKEVKRLLRLRRSLKDQEVSFIFDFILQMLRYAAYGEPIAVSLSTHLMRDFYLDSGHYFDHMINEFETKVNTLNT